MQEEYREYRKHQRLYVQIQCHRCGIEHWLLKSQYNRSKTGAHYCSVECHNQAQQEARRRSDSGEKLCNGCRRYLPLTEFHKRSGKTNCRARCKECNQRRHRERLLKLQYSVTIEDYEQMLNRQDGKCAICGQTERELAFGRKSVRRLCVDHNHVTGKARGLLCRKCNSGVAMLGDDLSAIQRAYQYMRKYEDPSS